METASKIIPLPSTLPLLRNERIFFFFFFNIVNMKTISRGGSKGKSINRLNFPLFASHLKIFIVNFDKSPTSHARINHHGVKLHHFRGLRTRIGRTGRAELGERGRLKTLINNKGREKGWLNISVGIIRHLVTSMKYFPACGNNYKGVGIILRAWWEKFGFFFFFVLWTLFDFEPCVSRVCKRERVSFPFDAWKDWN